MRRTFGWLTAGLIALGAQVAGAQESPNPGGTAPDFATERPAAQKADQRRELRRSGELPADRANAQDPATGAGVGPGVNIAVPGSGVDVNAARGAGLGVTAPGVELAVPPAGSGAGIGVNVPAAGINANVNPNAWRYRWHNNRWWYYHPNNQWSYWNNNGWIAHRVSSTAAANNYSIRRFSNAPRYQSGYRGLPNGAGAPSAVNAPTPSSVDKSPLERANPGDASAAPAP